MHTTTKTALRNLTREELAIAQLFVNISRHHEREEHLSEFLRQLRIGLSVAANNHETNRDLRKFAMLGLSPEQTEGAGLLISAYRKEAVPRNEIWAFLNTLRFGTSAEAPRGAVPALSSKQNGERRPVRAPLRMP